MRKLQCNAAGMPVIAEKQPIDKHPAVDVYLYIAYGLLIGAGLLRIVVIAHY
jgi:hypothetical protein